MHTATMHVDRLFKVLVVGDPVVGKTSFVQRFVHDVYTRHYRATVGVDFALKIIQWSETETVRLQLWDVAGQERFTSMTRLYYKDAAGCIVIFDVASLPSFHNCLKWKRDLDSKAFLPDGRPIQCILLANKSDLPDWAVSRAEIEQFSRDSGFLGWAETSVKMNHNITESIRVLVEEMLCVGGAGEPSHLSDGGYLQLGTEDAGKKPRRCC
ncbi:ras-related protein Rab-7L1 [Lampetra fluviatilis]